MNCIPSPAGRLEERALPGTHELVVGLASRYCPPPGRAVDLGAGSGALAKRLEAAGYSVLAVDLRPVAYPNRVQLDLNKVDFHTDLPNGFDVVTAVEVIEHLENPVGFLRNAASLVAVNGVVIITTPNVENVPARLKYLLTGKVRAMDGKSPEHLTPIVCDLFVRQHLPRAGLRMIDHKTHPRNDYPLTARRWLVPFFRFLAFLLPGTALTGDCHVFVLRRKG